MFLVGLTGGIASGKSTVAKQLVQLGAVEIDADILAREAVKKGSDALAEIANVFGQSIIDANGNLDRAMLAQIVFSNPDARKELESIVHPVVRKLAAKALKDLPDEAIAIYTVPLLVEADVSLPFDLIVTVEAPEATQIKRMMDSRNMTQEDATARIRSQASPAARANRADVILNSNQSLELLRDDVVTLWHRIVGLAAAKRGN